MYNLFAASFYARVSTLSYLHLDLLLWGGFVEPALDVEGMDVLFYPFEGGLCRVVDKRRYVGSGLRQLRCMETRR